jgi:hypothetical protein
MVMDGFDKTRQVENSIDTTTVEAISVTVGLLSDNL